MTLAAVSPAGMVAVAVESDPSPVSVIATSVAAGPGTSSETVSCTLPPAATVAVPGEREASCGLRQTPESQNWPAPHGLAALHSGAAHQLPFAPWKQNCPAWQLESFAQPSWQEPSGVQMSPLPHSLFAAQARQTLASQCGLVAMVQSELLRQAPKPVSAAQQPP